MDRTIQPTIKGIEPKKTNEITSITLNNGVPLISIPTKGNELVRIDFVFKGGQWLQEYPLQAHFALTQLKEGTNAFSSEEIADLFDKYGATIEIYTTLSFSCITVYCLKRFVSEILVVIRSMFIAPTYPENKFLLAKERSKTAYLINQQKVGTRCRQAFYQNVLGMAHPASKYPTMEDYDAISTDKLFDYRNRFLDLVNCTIYVTGNFDKPLYYTFEKNIGSLLVDKSKNVDAYKRIDIETCEEKKIVVEVGNENVQSSLRIGMVMDDLKHGELVTLKTANTVLGGYFGSRLTRKIREELGLTYDISSYVIKMPYNTIFVVATDTEKNNVDDVINETFNEINKLRTSDIDVSELEQVKNYMIGDVSRSLEMGYNLSSLLIRLAATGSNYDEAFDDCRIIRNITSGNIKECMERFFTPETMRVIVAR